MLETEGIKAERLGYDKPSNKFLNFLSKYYNLTDYTPQNNNFVVFDQYFKKNNSSHKSKSGLDLITVNKSPIVSKQDNANLEGSGYSKNDYLKFEKGRRNSQSDVSQFNEYVMI
jgi:hypothetical protein